MFAARPTDRIPIDPPGTDFPAVVQDAVDDAIAEGQSAGTDIGQNRLAIHVEKPLPDLGANVLPFRGSYRVRAGP